ncbi:MAG: TetR/AcrR family transcriptional regulator [Chloroflexi bacterium]|nr:TetR/AcrR family transcriptional regulator [Chloroflexota bacterium]
MARPAAITDQQILDAARDVFLAAGFQASTIEIARRAGVSHGTLFKRFATKDDLFRAALGLPSDPDWVAGLAERVGQGDLQQNLQILVHQIMVSFAEILPCLVALRARGFAPEPRHHLDPDSPPARFIRALSAYLQAEMDLGRARHGDPEILAHALLGPAVNFVMIETLGANTVPHSSRTEFAARLVDLIWRGVAPAAAEQTCWR